jgi:50S ribosomal protein L16 3-hydroxylase
VSVPLLEIPGIGRQRFLRDYWQRKPLLLRRALPDMQPLLSRRELFELALRDDVEARVVRREGRRWDVCHAPLQRRDLAAVRTPRWTLLVQGVDLHDERVARLLRRFRFLPDARLDDLMISWASDGGGVGPHVDEYDVFLLQAQGRRRWRIGPVEHTRLQPGQPLKLLRGFVPQEDFVVEPGDLLYLPPGWGHDGIADGECMTYSVGFRAPPGDELLRQLLWKMAEELRPAPRYSDRGKVSAAVGAHPARLPEDMVRFVAEAFARLRPGRVEFARALGELLTEPKQEVVFEAGDAREAARIAPRQGLRLDRRTRMLWSAAGLSINGESVPAGLGRSPLLRRLADARELDAAQYVSAGPAERELMEQWCAQGWAHAGRD